MRTNPVEWSELGRIVASKLNAAPGPVCLFIRRGGVPSVAGSGKVFFDPAVDDALIGALTETSSAALEVATGDAGIDDPTFASAMARKLHILVDQTKAQRDDQG